MSSNCNDWLTRLTTFFVCSHGGSVDRPILVGAAQKEWLESEGVKVYTYSEYLKLKEAG